MSQKNNLNPGGFITNPTYLQIIYPHLNWLLKQRNLVKSNERVGVNASIILFSAIFLEGFMEDILCSFISDYSDKTNLKKSPRLIAIEMISSLDKYKSEFEIFGMSLERILNDEKLEENLSIIFKLRNILAHGQRESYLTLWEIDRQIKEIEGSCFKDIEKFFVKRKIFKKSTKTVQPNMNNEIFSDSVADWVHKQSLKMASVIISGVSFKLVLQRGNQDFRLENLKRFFVINSQQKTVKK